MLKILKHYVKQENLLYTAEQIEKIQNIIRLKKRCESNIVALRKETIIELIDEKQNIQLEIH